MKKVQTYSLAEIRNGTGWSPDVRFQIVQPKATKAIKTTTQPTVQQETAQLSTAELYAYYKRTAPWEDLRFYRAHTPTLAADLRAHLDEIEQLSDGREVARRLQAVKLERAQRQARTRVDEVGFWQRLTRIEQVSFRKATRQQQHTAPREAPLTFEAWRETAMRNAGTWPPISYDGDSA